MEPAYLSKIERDQVAPPSEATIRRLAGKLGEDPGELSENDHTLSKGGPEGPPCGGLGAIS